MQMFGTRVKGGVLIGICLLTGTLQADIAIQPAFVEVNMDEGRPAGVFMVSNLGDKEERFRVNAVHFTYTEQGALTRSATGANSLAPWIRFNPRELTLAPGTRRAVRFAVVPRGKLDTGEYWAAMELESLAVNEVVSKNEKTGKAVKLRSVSSILAPVFGTVGKTSYEGQIKDLQVQVENGAVALKALIAATGTGRLGVKGEYAIVDAAGKVMDGGPFGGTYVLRGGQRWVKKTIGADIPKGEYSARVSLQAAHLEQPLVKEIRVAWPELPPAGAQPGSAPQQAASDKSVKSEKQSKDSTDGGKQPKAQGSTQSR